MIHIFTHFLVLGTLVRFFWLVSHSCWDIGFGSDNPPNSMPRMHLHFAFKTLLCIAAAAKLYMIRKNNQSPYVVNQFYRFYRGVLNFGRIFQKVFETWSILLLLNLLVQYLALRDYESYFTLAKMTLEQRWILKVWNCKFMHLIWHHFHHRYWRLKFHQRGACFCINHLLFPVGKQRIKGGRK